MESLTGSAASIHGGAPVKPLFSPFRHSPKLTPTPPRSLRLPLPSIRASSTSTSTSTSNPNPLPRLLKSTAAGALLLSATAFAVLPGKPLARADPSPPPANVETLTQSEPRSDLSPLSELLGSNPEAIAALRTLLYRKLEDGEDSEALSILNRLISTQPSETEWKFLAARLLHETGDPAESRRLYEEILAIDPLSFEALFQNAVLMAQLGEGEAVIERLERALELARSEQKEKAARDIRLIMAQIQFLQKNVDEALGTYEELAKEDPKDYRPFFCQGVIYSLMERNTEAREKFKKYHELAPRKFEVDAFLQTPLSRVKLFGTEEEV